MKFKYSAFLIMISIILFSFLALADKINYDNYDYKIDRTILEKMNHKDQIRVFVHLKNTIDESIMSAKTFYEKRKIQNIIISKVHSLQNYVIDNISSDDMQVVGKLELYPGFSAFVNKKSLLQLQSNYLVERIEDDEIEIRKTSLSDNSNMINADKLWPLGYNGTGVVTCILDSGINYSHPNLGNCNNVANISDGSCPTILGGHNFCANEECTTENENPVDNNGHGTFVAGILISNDSSQRGIAFGSKLVIVKVLNSTGRASESVLAIGIDWCINNSISRGYNATIFTISVSGVPNNSISCNSISSSIQANRAVTNNIFVSTSSGNDANYTVIGFPACASNVTSVGATYNYYDNFNNFNSTKYCEDRNVIPDRITCYTNRNQQLDLLAPSENVTSTFYQPFILNFSYFGGTSAAAPHVAGVAALMLQAANQSGITLTPSQIEITMKRTGRPIYDSATGLTFPRIDAYRSVMAVLYDVFVADLDEIYYDNQGRSIFEFSVFNDIGSNVTVNWTIDFGDGSNLTSSGFVMNPAISNSSAVYADHMYSSIGKFNVTVTARSSQGSVANQTMEISVTKPNFRVLNLTTLNSTGLRRVFEFMANNNASASYGTITWQLNITGESSFTAANQFALANNESILVYVDYTYANAGGHNITATADHLNVHSEFNEADNSMAIYDA